MGSKKKNEDKRFYEDIGLLFTKGKAGNGVQFYQHTVPNGNIKVGSDSEFSKLGENLNLTYLP